MLITETQLLFSHFRTEDSVRYAASLSPLSLSDTDQSSCSSPSLTGSSTSSTVTRDCECLSDAPDSPLFEEDATFMNAAELSLKLVQLDLGDRNDACQGVLDILSKAAKNMGSTLAESMSLSCTKYCQRKLHLRTLSEFQRIVEMRWGHEHNSWTTVMDMFEREIRLVLDPQMKKPHDIGLALVFLAVLAILAKVELGRPLKQTTPKKKLLLSQSESSSSKTVVVPSLNRLRYEDCVGVRACGG